MNTNRGVTERDLVGDILRDPSAAEGGPGNQLFGRTDGGAAPDGSYPNLFGADRPSSAPPLEGHVSGRSTDHLVPPYRSPRHVLV